MTYHNTIPNDEIDPPAVRWGEDPPPVSSWQRYLAESGRGRDRTAARAAVSPAADPRDCLAASDLGVDARDTGGVAFDTDMLSRPTQRRLMTLWCELAGIKTAILPAVMGELAGEVPGAVRRGSERLAVHRSAWRAIVSAPRSPFRLVAFAEPDARRIDDILMSFNLSCFPMLNNVDEIEVHADAIIVAQGLAAGMDVIVTNNMASMDHREINHLVREKFGMNSGLLVAGDDALLQAHQGAEGSRRLLTLALASAWPEDGRPMDVGEAEEALLRLCERLAGAAMADTAQRIQNRFKIDCDLETLLADARETSTASNALRHERIRAQWTASGRVDCSLLPATAAAE